jgi:ubiquinone/menaquinone biosynthesis C-methylase UbiE
VTFTVSAEAYDRFMGRYSGPLAPVFADFAGVVAGQRVVDVGSGPGSLTTELVARLGAASVAAADPMAPFVAAARERHPGVDVREAPAESLPFADAAFDAALAQLVVQFMADPYAGVREMARVTRSGGAVAACIWNHGPDGTGPLSLFWKAVHELRRDAPTESRQLGASDGDLVGLFEEVGLADVEQSLLAVTVEHATFEDWWEPFTFGVGPAGVFVAGLAPDEQEELRERCRALQPAPPFTVTAEAWAARGTVR